MFQQNKDGKITSANLVPAYGRNYQNSADALHAFQTGRDFKIAGDTRYTSIRDFAEGAMVEIRYGKNYDKCCLISDLRVSSVCNLAKK
jgi:hypothetical protein